MSNVPIQLRIVAYSIARLGPAWGHTDAAHNRRGNPIQLCRLVERLSDRIDTPAHIVDRAFGCFPDCGANR